MKPWIKRIIILYLIIVFLKIGLSYFILAPSAFSDDYGYAKEARSVFYNLSFVVHDVISARPPLYSAILSVSYFLKDMELVYFFMKLINAVVSSLVIFPAWLLSKEFFNEKKSMLLTIMVAMLPANFSFTFLIMSENLFFPLFLFSIYLVYKSFTEKGYRWDILAGIFIGLAYLTKINALILPLSVVPIFLFKLSKKEYKEISKKVIMAFFFLITISPWLIRNGLNFGFNKNLFSGGYDTALETTTSSLSSSPGNFLYIFLTWFVLYMGYLMLASGFIFFIANFFTLNKLDKNAFVFSLLTISSTALLAFLASKPFPLGTQFIPGLTGRIIGRYVEAAIPLILINGLLGLKHLKKISKIYIIPVIVLLFSSQLVFCQLFPTNNMSLAWLGVLKFIFDFLVYNKITFESVFSYWYMLVFSMIFLIILSLILYLYRKVSVRKLLLIFIIFFSLVSLLNFAIIYYNSYTFWYKGEQTQLGLWFNKYDSKISTVLFDERDGCKIFKTNQTCIYNPFTGGGSATVIGFWMNDEIKIGSVENLEGVDYVVSRHNLDLPLLKETKNGIFLYQVNRKN
jgi:hypothetical protein